MAVQETLNLDKPMFPIGAVAETLNVHQRTLRIYDEENVLVPYRSPKNRRLYSIRDIQKGKLIQFMTKEMALNLNAVKCMLSMAEKMNLDNFDEMLRDLALRIGISPEEQQLNRKKLSARGRKPKLQVISGGV